MFPYRKVVFQKPDLDTALTAVIEGVRPDVAELVAVSGSASAEDRNDSTVLCIECTGSGDLVLSNRDHHAGPDSRPACVQAFEAVELWLRKLKPLVQYVAEVDIGKKSFHRLSGGPSLVWLYSGLMVFYGNDKVQQFWASIRLLLKVLELNLDPYGPMNKVLESMPEAVEWDKAKREHERWSRQVVSKAQYTESKDGVLIAYVVSNWKGAVGLLQATETKGQRKPNVVICLSTDFHHDGSGFCKYSVAASAADLSKLKLRLNEIEPGWGGPVRENPKKDGAFLGSPLAASSAVELEDVVQMVMDTVTSDCLGVTTKADVVSLGICKVA